MKIALVFPKFERQINDNLQITTVKKYAITPLPLSLTYLAATLERAGHDVEIIDANALKYSKEQLVSILKNKNIGLIGFTTTTLAYHQENEWIKYVKDNLPDIPIIVGGKHAWYYPEEIMKNYFVDYAFNGEADFGIVELADALEKSNLAQLKNIKGLWYKSGNKVYSNGIADPIANLDDLPFPARHLLPLGKYGTFITKRQKYSTMMTTRGCPARCTFCDGHLEKFRFRSAKNAVEEIQLAYDMGVREIELYDDSFTAHKKRAIEIAKEIKERKLDLSWDIRTRVNMVDGEILKVLKSAGCQRINLGIESADPQILRNLKKDITLDQVEKAVLLSKKLGLEVFGYFILGSPGETIQTIRKTLAFSQKYPFDYVQFTRMTALPRTELYRQFMEERKYDYWLEYTQGKHLDKQIELVNTELTDQQVTQAVKDAYKGFYLRPKQVIKTLLNTRSVPELLRYVSAGTNFILRK